VPQVIRSLQGHLGVLFVESNWIYQASLTANSPESPNLWGVITTRYDILFVMRLATRGVHVGWMVPAANGMWMEQVASSCIAKARILVLRHRRLSNLRLQLLFHL